MLQPRTWTIAGLLAGAILLAAGAAFFLYISAPKEGGGLDPAAIALGGRLYAAHCASCHGEKLEGQPNWQERRADGRLPAPPHDASGHTWHHPDALLFAITKEGPAALASPGYESDMPGFADKLSDEEIRAVFAFIKSTWPEPIRRQHEAINERAGEH